jgi:aminoglycoside 2'-N-acetyltransferase I
MTLTAFLFLAGAGANLFRPENTALEAVSLPLRFLALCCGETQKMEMPKVRIVIRSTQALTAAEKSQVSRVLDEAFAHDDFGRRYQWADNDWSLLLDVGGEVVSHVGVVERTVTVEGSPLRVGGISAVATAARWQRRGLAQQLLAKAADFMRADLRADFGLLICDEHKRPYYSRLGWHVVAGPLRVDQPQGKITMPTLTMVCPLTGRLWPTGTIDLCGLPW